MPIQLISTGVSRNVYSRGRIYCSIHKSAFEAVPDLSKIKYYTERERDFEWTSLLNPRPETQKQSNPHETLDHP